jgi:PAS domain S-box-containing protein
MITYIVIAGASLIIIGAIMAILFLSQHKKSPGKSSSSLANALTDEKMKSDIILNSIVDGVMLIDTEGVIQLCNPAAGVITGWKQNEVVGLDYKLVLQFVDDKGNPYDPTNEPIKKANDQSINVHDRHISLKTQGKNIISLDISVSPLLEQDGSTKGVLVVFRDISEERKEEAQRAEFISTASHEMRTPVAAIEGYLALALNDKVSKIDEKAKGFLEKAHESTQHLGKLFQDLLTSAKAEDGRLMNNPVVVEMSEFLEKLTDGLKFSAQKKGLSVEFLLGSPDSLIDASNTGVVKPLYYVHVDPDRLREVITNLFDNAVKYTESGKVSIGLTGDNDVVQIRVTDTGPGIPAQDVPHLFQKFYRVDNSATRTIGGTGLGLFISRKIIELYNGRIWVESELNKGSTFYINLPRLKSDQAEQLKRKESVQLPQISPVGANL